VKKSLPILSAILVCAGLLYAQESALKKLEKESLRNPQVYSIAKKIANIPSRLTNSPNLSRARSLCAAMLKSWGLQHVEEESWGEFGPGWSPGDCSLELVNPLIKKLQAQSKAWSIGLDPVVEAELYHLQIDSIPQLQSHQGKLKDKIVLLDLPRLIDEAKQRPRPGGRLSDEYLKMLESILAPQELSYLNNEGRIFLNREKVFTFLKEEKPILILEKAHSMNGKEIVGGFCSRTEHSNSIPGMWIFGESYSELLEIVATGQRVVLKAEMKTRFYQKNTQGKNLIAELRGSINENVLVGAHLDSVYASSGALDNAAGVAIAMEAMRILKQSGLKLKRSVRLILWDGEEQGMLGSLGYIRKHYITEKGEYTAGHGKVSAYLNIDQGSGRIRGINTQNNYQVIPFFRKVFKKLNDPDIKTVSPRLAAGSDHLSFDGIGIPAFIFIQDPLDYYLTPHHSAEDTWERLNGDDLKQASLVVAWTLYNVANAESLLPREKFRKVELPESLALRKITGEFVLPGGRQFSLYVEQHKLYFSSPGYRELEVFFQGNSNFIIPELGVKFAVHEKDLLLNTVDGRQARAIRQD
jgi:carboxypeptidase Q